ncbi:uncharacterized protein L201_005953 [Kwoniella dendrophila CBS 6074]|uniref:MIP18 family-like domain-containing protein n=1 Tax=Kwoniella dendrophila CBS 6074 TaxID=1295534 RepID=A0AAX4K1I6_9TREE
MSRQLDNDNPTIFAPAISTSTKRVQKGKASLWSEEALSDDDYGYESNQSGLGSGGEQDMEDIDAEEVYDLLRSITDPEHPVSLEALRVVNPDDIHVAGNRVLVYLTPTIPHCSMSTLIGLSLRVRLLRALPTRYKVDIRIKSGTHQSEHAVNKQLNDKERVQAALENKHLLNVVEGCLMTADKRGN